MGVKSRIPVIQDVIAQNHSDDDYIWSWPILLYLLYLYKVGSMNLANHQTSLQSLQLSSCLVPLFPELLNLVREGRNLARL